jgi:hypothetical protein
MRKICLLSVIISTFITSTTIAGNDPINSTKKSDSKYLPAPSYTKKITEGGFYFHLGVMLPTKNYYYPKGVLNTTDKRFSVGGGLELGDLFALVETHSDACIGLRVTLINALYTSFSYEGKTVDQVLQGSIFDLGPNFTIGLDKQNAIDIYYQFCPTYMYNLKDTITYTASGAYGFNHTFGVGYRYNLLSVGATFNLGNVKYIDATSNDKYMKHCMDHFRFFVGMMF